MIRLIIFFLVLCGVRCNNTQFHFTDVHLEKNKPLSLPGNAATHVCLVDLNGDLYSDFLSQLNITSLLLQFNKINYIEPGSVCSARSLKSLKLYLGAKPITVTKEIVKNCEELEALVIEGFPYRRHVITTDALTNLPNLRDLSIFYINVHHITKEHFKDLSSLEHLKLEDCFLEEVDTDAFDSLRNLKELQVITRGFSTHNFEILSNHPIKVENLTFGGLNGTLHKSKLDVKNFYLEAYQLDNIETGALCPTSSIKKLELEFKSPNSIKFTKDTFQNCENLEEMLITADETNLSKIEADSFQNLANLKKLSLENVRIKHVTKDTFKNSLLLKNLLLCNVQEVDSDAFNHFQHLKEVEICVLSPADFNTEPFLKNTIKVDKLTLKHLTGKLCLPQLTVKELYLHFDYLSEIESEAVCSSPSLKKFSLEFSTPTNPKFTKETLNCKRLKELSLIGGHRKPAQIQEEVFENLPNLKVLDLHRFNFSHVKREYFKKFVSLEKLVLDNCSVTEFDNDAFDDLKNLKVLQISNTRELTHIPENLFTKNTKLEKLLLSSNEISDLTWDEFKGLPALTTLSLRDNPISSFSAEKIAQNIPSLQKIDIVATFTERDAYYGFVEELKKKLNVTFAV